MAARGDYFRFGFYLKNNPTEIKNQNRNRFKATGFGSIILEQKPKPNRLTQFFSSLALLLILVWFFSFRLMKPNQSVFKNILIGFICFFFHGSVFLFIFFQFSLFFIFLLTPNGHATKPKDIGFSCLARSKIDGSGWAVRPNLFLKCFGSGSATPNNIGSCWAGGPNAIGSFWKCFGPG